MDSEGKDIVEEQQLGLLLYRGAVFCGSNKEAADAICMKMNFTRAETSTSKLISGIPDIEDKVLGKTSFCSYNNYDLDGCNYYEDYNCGGSKYMFLNCTGAVVLLCDHGRRDTPKSAAWSKKPAPYHTQHS